MDGVRGIMHKMRSMLLVALGALMWDRFPTGQRLWSIVLFAACALSAAAQPITGRVVSVGFPVPCPTGRVVRAGQWFPIQVDLAVQGTDIFAGELRFEAVDLDGDRVAYGKTGVTVTANPDGRARRVWCYAVINTINELAKNIDVISERGETIARLPLSACDVMSNDELLVLDISQRSVAALNQLTTPNWSPGQRTEGTREFYRDVVVSKMPPEELPDRWWGLEMVDVVCWDQPDPAKLGTAQVDALIEWVGNGGQLIVGVGAQWKAIRDYAELAAIMPLQGEGPTVEATDLRAFREQMARPGWTQRGFDSPIAVTTAELAPDAIRTQGDWGPGNIPLNLISMRLVGSGRVVATAASLRDLSGVDVDDRRFFGTLLDLNRYSAKFKENQNSLMAQTLADASYLYDDLVKPIGFGTATAIRGLTAFLFVGAYILLATVASWWWLKARKLTHLSWSVFAGCAVLASVLSLGTVAGMRGLSRGVQALSVLDLEEGTPAARGTCWFGYRSPIRQRVELALPDGNGNFLRPLSRGPKLSSYYVTPARYAGIPTKARLENVLMRATLKQVEGFWHGELDGTLQGQLTASRDTGRLTPGSSLTNDLNVNLEGGYLLYIDPRQDNGGVPRAAGLTTLYDDPVDIPEVPPARNILAVQIGRIGPGQRVTELGAAGYEKADEDYRKWISREAPKRKDMPDLQTLWHEQLNWRPSVGTPGALNETVRATLLASTRSLHLHNRTTDPDSVGTPLSTDGLPDLDVSHWLLRGYAVLLTWSNDPGPAQLQLNGRSQESYGGMTVYRVRIPLRYVGNPPPRRGGGL